MRFYLCHFDTNTWSQWKRLDMVRKDVFLLHKNAIPIHFTKIKNCCINFSGKSGATIILRRFDTQWLFPLSAIEGIIYQDQSFFQKLKLEITSAGKNVIFTKPGTGVCPAFRRMPLCGKMIRYCHLSTVTK